MACLFVGLVTGLVGGFLQASRTVTPGPWGVLIVPWGLVITIILLLVLIRGGAWLTTSRWGAGSVLVGWLIATIALSTESPSGDLALSGGTRQWVYLLAGVILGSAASTFPVTERH